MDKPKRKKLRVNLKFQNGAVVCAKSPGQCKECEKIDLYYYPFTDRDIKECFKNNENKR